MVSVQRSAVIIRLAYSGRCSAEGVQQLAFSGQRLAFSGWCSALVFSSWRTAGGIQHLVFSS